ncbi:MAG: hypothetical protein AB1540_08850 [Bdellovibrionota bacterium]
MYGFLEKIPVYNLIFNGYPENSHPIKRPIDDLDVRLWSMSGERKWAESGAWRLISYSGEVLAEKLVPGELGFIADIDVHLKELADEAINQMKIDPRSIELASFRHTHTSRAVSGIAIPSHFSKGDGEATQILRKILDEDPALSHVHLESQIIFQGNPSWKLMKKAYVLKSAHPR